MKPTVTALLATLLALSSVQAGSMNPCEEIPQVPESLAGESLAAGNYDIQFVVTRGNTESPVVNGTLQLLETSSTDTSPRTGEQAQDRNLLSTPLYGWTTADLKAAGATICRQEPHPDPTSTDPVYPGVLT